MKIGCVMGVDCYRKTVRALRGFRKEGIPGASAECRNFANLREFRQAMEMEETFGILFVSMDRFVEPDGSCSGPGVEFIFQLNKLAQRFSYLRIFFFTKSPLIWDFFRIPPAGVLNCMDDTMVLGRELQKSATMSYRKYFSVECRNGIYRIPTDHIIYVEYRDRKLELNLLKQEVIRVPKSMSWCAGSLCEKHPEFIRVHSSFLVNMNHVRSLDRHDHLLTMTNGVHIPVSESLYTDFRREMRGK